MARAAGAIISINTKSGTNQFHGGVFYAGRNDALNANNWFANHDGLGNAEERRNDYGYNISGPVVKDKLFLWWNQEWNKRYRVFLWRPAFRPLPRHRATLRATPLAPLPSTRCDAANATRKHNTGGKIANPDAAGLLIAQFYPAPNLSTLNNGNNYSQLISNHLNWSEWNIRGVIGLNTNRSIDTPIPLISASVSPNASKSTGGFLPNSWPWSVSLEQEVARNTCKSDM